MFDLTPAEKRVILIVAVVIVSAGFFKIVQPFTAKSERFDYSESDSIFSRLSHQPRLVSSDKKVIVHQEQTENLNKNNRLIVLQEGSIDINTADETELKKLPRIGPAMAKRIIEYRDKNGPFNTLKELTKVKGIGKKTFEKLRPFLVEID